MRKAITSLSRVIFPLLVSFSILPGAQPVFGSALSDLAASMQPGTWATLTTNNFNDGAILRPQGSILEYQDKALWNPRNNTMMVMGGAHPGGALFARYTESTNSWANNLPLPPFDGGHNYHHDTIVPVTGDFYHRDYYKGIVRKFSHATQTWSQCSSWGYPGAYQVAGAMEYFPDRNSLVMLDGDWGVWELSLASGNCLGTWVQRAATLGGGFSPQLTGLGSYHNQSRYSPNCKCIIMGGGSPPLGRTLYRYDSNGIFTSIAPPPAAITEFSIPYADRGDIFVIDPVSGNLLIWYHTNSANTMYEYDPAANTWATISRANPIFPGPEGGVTETVAVPISNYRVIMFVQAGSSAGGKVYLYKHAGGSGSPTPPPPSDTVAPSIPSGVSAVAASSSQINISWVASTDNVGVEQYKVYRSGAQIGIATTTLYLDSTVSPSTSYTYTVAAYDAAGNPSAQSASASATTPSAVFPPPPSGTSDFQTRCSQAGVVKCVGFDSQSEITGDWGINPQGSIKESLGGPTVDSSIKASGNGSLKFVIAPGSKGSVGSFFANFSDDLSTQFGENSEFYAQWRMRIDDNFYAATQGRAGMKHAIIGTGSRPGIPVASCTDLELVVQNNSARGFPQMYHSCGGGPINYEPIFDDRYGAYDFKLQNARPSPYCLYSQGYTTPISYFPSTGNCFRYFPNEWVTFQVHVKLGPLQQIGGYWYLTNSTVELWLARDGQPSELVISAPGRNLEVNKDPLQKYGQIWLLPYSGSDVYPNGGIAWYDELIISQSKISDPTSVPVGQSLPAAPSNLTLK